MANSLPDPLPDAVLRARRIADHLHLVRSIAVRIHATVPRHIELGALVHAGMVGLSDAASRFDPSKEVVFPSYAKYRIQGSILDSFRWANHVSDDLRKTTSPLEFTAPVATISSGKEISASQ